MDEQEEKPRKMRYKEKDFFYEIYLNMNVILQTIKQTLKYHSFKICQI